MQRRDALRSLAGATIGASIAGCSAITDRRRFTEGFESGLGEWESKAAIGPEVDVRGFQWTVRTSGRRASEGDRSVRITNEGDYDDGTTWIETVIEVRPNRRYRATVSAQFWSQSESFNTLRNAVARLGPQPATAEEDFPDPGMNTTELGETPYGGLREPLHLAEGWREYRFEWQTPRLSIGTLHLAFGTTVVWETEATHFLDEIDVELVPLETPAE